MGLYLVYEQIVNYYFKKILEKELLPGDQLESEIATAKKFEVSRGTVTKAFNYLKKIGVCSSGRGQKTVVSLDAVDIIRCLNATISDSHKIICILVVNKDEYLGYIVRCIKERAELMGWSCVVMYNYDQIQEKICIEKIIEKKYDGLIVTPYRSNGHFCKENYQKLQKEKIPFVMIGKPDKCFQCNAVYTDDFMGSYDITNKLISDKYGQIIHVTDRREDKIVYDDRMKGYLEALISSNQKTPKIFDCSDIRFKKHLTEFLKASAEKKIGINLYSDKLEPYIRPVLEALDLKSEINYKMIGFHEQYDNNGNIENNYLFMGVRRKEIAIHSLSILKNCMESATTDENSCVTHTIFSSGYKVI